LGMRKILDSFNYAVAGIIYAVKTQRNMRIHLTAALFILGLAFYMQVSSRDLLLLFFTITLVVMAELFNTAIEAVVDLCVQEFHPLAKIAKNVSAGAVLITALNSLAVAYIIFYPRLEASSFNLGHRVKETPLSVTLIALLLVIVLVTVGKALTTKGTYVKGGMPSGHTAVAFAGCTALAMYTGSALVASIALVIALLVAHSRLDTEVHTLLEVVAGALLGILATVVVFKLAGW